MNFRLNYTTHEFLIQIHLNRQPTASLNPLAPTPLTPNRLHMSVHHYTYLTHCLPKAVLTHSVNSILVLVNFTIEHKTNSFGLWKLDFHFDSHSWYSGANLVVTLFPSFLPSFNRLINEYAWRIYGQSEAENCIVLWLYAFGQMANEMWMINEWNKWITPTEQNLTIKNAFVFLLDCHRAVKQGQYGRGGGGRCGALVGGCCGHFNFTHFRIKLNWISGIYIVYRIKVITHPTHMLTFCKFHFKVVRKN